MLKLVGISLILAVIQMSESGPVYQFLPPRDGYVPVYIRLGDTPLDEINPDLALAFHESNIHTRNANDLDEQMLNDAPSNDDLSESVEDVSGKERVTPQKDANSDEDQTPEASVKSSNDEQESEEKSVPQQDTPVPDNKSEEEANSEEEPASTKLTKENDSDEIVVPTTTKKSKVEDNSSEEVSKGRRNVSLPPTSANVEESSEENDSKVTEKQQTSSPSNESSEEVDNK